MSFDPSTATPEESFDPTSAVPFDPTTASPVKQARSIIDEMQAEQKSRMKKMPDIGLGVLEQPAAIAGSIGSMALTGIESLVSTAMKPDSVMSGKSFYDRFTDDYNKRSETYAETDPFTPQTESGKQMAEALGRIFQYVQTGVGDLNYNFYRLAGELPLLPKSVKDTLQQEIAPAMGAAAQAVFVAGTVLAPLAKGGKPSAKISGAAEEFAAKYPDAARQMDAASVGTPPTEVPSPRSVVDLATEAVNTELGITPEMIAKNPKLVDMPLAEKIQVLAQKKGAETGELITPDMSQVYANDVTSKLVDMQKLDEVRPLSASVLENKSFIELGQKSDDLQILIDKKHDELQSKGLTWEQQNADAGLQSLYDKRIAYDTAAAQKGYNESKVVIENKLKDIISSSKNIRIDSILSDVYSLSSNPNTGVYMMAKYTSEALNSPKTISKLSEKIEKILFESKYPNADFNMAMNTNLSGLTNHQRSSIKLEAQSLAADIHNSIINVFTPKDVTSKSEGTSIFDANSKARNGAPVTGGGEGKAFLKAGSDAMNSTDSIKLTTKPNAIKLYRGSTSNTGDGIGIFMTPIRGVAESYAGKFGKVTSRDITFSNILDANTWTEAKTKLGLGKQNTMPDLISAAKDAGYDGISFNTLNGKEYIVIDSNLKADPTAIPTKSAVRIAKDNASWENVQQDVAAAQAKKIMQGNIEALADSRKIRSDLFLKNARRRIYSHNYDLKAALRRAGPEGEDAFHKMVVQPGATMAAKISADRINAGIFNKLSHDRLWQTNELTRLRRVVQIDKYKGIGSVRHEDGLTGPMANARIEQMKQELGPAFNEAYSASTAIFEEQKMLLNKLRDKGLISDELHKKMYNLDYERTEYLDMIDPEIPIMSHVKGMKTSISSSGIPKLGHGKKSYVNIDAQQLLMEDVARVENRIFRNNTLQAVRSLAEKVPDNDIVKLPGKNDVKVDTKGDMTMRHTPEGFTAIGVRVGGRQEFILMKDEYAEQFVARPEAMPEWLATTVRMASGSSLLKLTATGMNPSFVIAGIPMDILHTWLAGTTYSPHPPMFIAQMGKDMAVTAKDAFTKKGAWEDAMREGMGGSYLTHESRSMTDPSKGVHTQIAARLQKTKTALSYLNDTTDMWVRLAYRNRLMSEGMDSSSATAMARDRLDYFQGGDITKAFDTGIPYLNVGIQGTGKVIEAGARDPGRLATQVAWVVGTAASFKLASMITSPETDKSISVMDKVRNVNITFGDSLFTHDQNGNKRYLYCPVRIDQTLMPINAAVVGGLEKAEYGKVPHGLAGNAFGQISPINSAIPIPTLDAIASYVSNYDNFTGSAIYKGPPVLPKDEIRSFGEGTATQDIFKGLGQVTGMSPMRLQAAAGSLVASNNFYISAMGGIYKYVFDGADPRDQAASTMVLLTQSPGLRNVCKLTSPGAEAFDDLMKAEQEVGSKFAPVYHGLNDLVFQQQHGQNGVNTQTISGYINAQPPEMRQKLFDHAKYTLQVGIIMDRFKASDEIPQKSWWVASAKAPPEVRAQVFYNEWVSANPANRERMLGIASSLQNAGVGYASDDFKRYFAKERQMMGDEHR